MTRRLAYLLLTLTLAGAAADDPRNIATGFVIPDEGYADQPYVVKTGDGQWLCVLTTGAGVEGQGGQHIISQRSADYGKTWSEPVDIEPASGPEASWAMPLKTLYGRVYVFYTYNRDNVRVIPGGPANRPHRVDTLGAYAFKYSDDHGRSWSKDRHYIPLRTVPADLENEFGGQELFFWGVGKPMTAGGAMYFGFAKVLLWGFPAPMQRSRGFVVKSANILNERDPKKLRFEILPESDGGLRAPKGAVAEETNVTALASGALYAVYRTIDGYLCDAYSQDGGHTWTGPRYAVFATGKPIKQPRAFSCLRRFSNGKYLLWHHNHGGEPVHLRENWKHFSERNPGWISGGVERNGKILWSEPEILLYDDDPGVRISYPDLIEDEGRYFITETQKTVARVHEIDRSLLEGLWSQFDRREVAREGLAVEAKGAGAEIAMPALRGAGFALDFWVRFKDLLPGQVIVDAREDGKGVRLSVSNRCSLKLEMSDGKVEAAWESDPGTFPGTLKVDEWQHVAAIVDGGPKIVSFVIDGVLNDGGPVRQFGWGRFPKELADVNGARRARLAPELHGELGAFRIYTRMLRTSEAVANYRAGR